MGVATRRYVYDSQLADIYISEIKSFLQKMNSHMYVIEDCDI